MTDDIAALIKELKDLKIREAGILARLEAANERNRPSTTGGSSNDQDRTNGDLPTSTPLRGLKTGDRVKTINRLRKPASWPDDIEWDEGTARLATVTKVDVAADRVYIATDNGFQTWRMRANLRRL